MLNGIEFIANQTLILNDRINQLAPVTAAISAIGRVSAGPEKELLQDVAISARIKTVRSALDSEDSPVRAEEVKELIRSGLLSRSDPLLRRRLSAEQALKKRTDMSIAKYDSRHVFVEYKSVQGPLRSKLLARADGLAALLGLPKDKTFRSLACQGVVSEPDEVAFIFEWPKSAIYDAPRSLLEMFATKTVPSLSRRIKLALQIAQAVERLHLCGWLHKSIRSDNILFFTSEKPGFSEGSLDNPYLAGFAFARGDSATEISEQPSINPRNDIYRHPSALGEPSLSFQANFDAYSLGTVLLEIAMWRDLARLVKECIDISSEVSLQSITKVRPFLIEGHGERGSSNLSARAGDLYAQAVMMCLEGKNEVVLTERQSQEFGFEPKTFSVLGSAVNLLKQIRI